MWVIYAVLAAVAYGTWALLLRIGMVAHQWGQVLAAAVITEAVLVLIIVRPAGFAMGAVFWGVLAGICAAVGYLLFSMSLSEAKSTLPVVIMSAYPVLVVIVSVVALGDVIDWTRWAG